MGVGYQVSPIHRLIRMDTAGLKVRPASPGESPLFDAIRDATGSPAQVSDEPLRTRSPDVRSILAWRRRIGIKYRDQLGENLDWSERSTYEDSEDVATSGDVILHFAATVLDRSGQAGLTNMIRRRRPKPDEMEAAFAAAERRGFGGRFPQLLLGASFWLPFSRNMMIEEPDWDGVQQRFGSVPRLLDEITVVRAALAEADPSVQRAAEIDTPEYSLAAAWQTSTTVLRLAIVAARKHLPLWKTG
jgi:hypothetical protein